MSADHTKRLVAHDQSRTKNVKPHVLAGTTLGEDVEPAAGDDTDHRVSACRAAVGTKNDRQAIRWNLYGPRNHGLAGQVSRATVERSAVEPDAGSIARGVDRPRGTREDFAGGVGFMARILLALASLRVDRADPRR